MPNGGPDNCAACGLNRTNAGEWISSADAKLEPGFCTIRFAAIRAPHWTYCKNWHSRKSTPEGPIYASMYDNGYRRVPWLHKTEPETGVDTVCLTCATRSSDGIRLLAGEDTFEFCGREHYLAWRELGLIARMRECIHLGEKAYSEMYDSRSPAGKYSDAKDFFVEAMHLASDLESAKEEQEMRERLEHIQKVYRSQF